VRLVRSGHLVALLLVAAALVPASAGADDPPACRVGGGPPDYQARLVPLLRLAEADGAGRQALGPQFALMWLDNRRQGWDIGVAPGALDLDQARDAIVAQLRSRVSADDAAQLASTLHVEPEPYGEADLRAVQQAIVTQMSAANLGVGSSVGVGCTLSDAFRVEVELYNDSSPATVDAVKSIVAPFGDRALLDVKTTGPPVLTVGVVPARPARVSDYLAMASPRTCIKADAIRLRPTAQARARLALVTVAVGHRRLRAGPKRMTHAIRIALPSRRTVVTLAVRLRDGSRAHKTLVYRRCR
jgi:hypothetical protein